MEVPKKLGPTNSSKSLFHRLLVKLSLLRKDATEMQWSIVIIVFTSMFASCYSITYIFPFVPEMIIYFGYAEEDKGYYAGIIASGIFAGRMFGSYFWGRLSDMKGRKPVLIVCLVMTSITNILFGFSTNIYFAFFTRFINGLCNSVIIVAKCILYEISDNSNQAVAMSSISLAWGSGIILGPLISGYLANPVYHFPEVFASDGFFGQYPYALPSLVAGMICFMWIPVIMWKLPETREKRKVVDELEVQYAQVEKNEQMNQINSQYETEILDEIMKQPEYLDKSFVPNDIDDFDFIDADITDDCALNNGISIHSFTEISVKEFMTPTTVRKYPRNTDIEKNRTDKAILVDVVVPKESSENITSDHHIHSDNNESIKVAKKSGWRSKILESNFVKFLRMKDVRSAVAIYGLVSFATIGWEESFTVFCSTARYLDGFGFSTEQIGNALGLSSAPLIIIQVFLFPILEKRIGAKAVFEYFCLYLILSASTIICLRTIVDKTQIFWALLLISMALVKISQTTCFTAISLFVNNSVSPDYVGSVNGMAMTITAALRFLAPTLGGSLYAWSISYGVNIGFPLDVNLVFIMFSGVYFLCNVICALASERLNRQSKK